VAHALAWSWGLTLCCARGRAVSQFTLQAVLKGHKPDYHMAMKAAESRAFYDAFVGSVRQAYKPEAIKGAGRARLARRVSWFLSDGVFGAYMEVLARLDMCARVGGYDCHSGHRALFR
jgi:D-Tyr-tRNAtyr deacylase